jgi:uncharacterized protein DUF3987
MIKNTNREPLAEWPPHPRRPLPPEPDRLPIEVLPPVLLEAAMTLAQATQTPTDAAVAAVLGAVSVAVTGQALVEICPRRKWRKPIQTFVGIEMPSGTGKDPLISMVASPIKVWEAERAAAERPARRLALERHNLAEEAVSRTRKAAAAPRASQNAQADYQNATARLDQMSAAPTGDFQLLVQDATEEKMIRIMAAHGGRIACIDSEATLLELAAGRYSGDARVALLTHGWDGESMRVDRMSGDPVDIPAAYLSMLVGLQPGVLAGLRNSRTMGQRGVWARMLWVSPTIDWDNVLTGSDVPALDISVMDRFEDMITKLLSLLSVPNQVLTMSPEAQHGVHHLEKLKVAGMRPGGPIESIPGWGGKLPDHGSRIAALLTVAHRASEGVDDPYRDPIPGWAMDSAIHLVRAFASHVIKVTNPCSSDPLLEDARYVLDRMMRLPAAKRTMRELQRKCDSRPSLRRKDDLEPVVADLVRRGCLRVTPEATGGRPTKRIELHPDLLIPAPLDRRASMWDTPYEGSGDQWDTPEDATTPQSDAPIPPLVSTTDPLRTQGERPEDPTSALMETAN